VWQHGTFCFHFKGNKRKNEPEISSPVLSLAILHALPQNAKELSKLGNACHGAICMAPIALPYSLRFVIMLDKDSGVVNLPCKHLQDNDIIPCFWAHTE
jgi:hypothetical protein